MVKVVRRTDETSDDVIRRYKSAYKKSGIREECKNREYFLKKSLKRKRKSAQARIKARLGR